MDGYAPLSILAIINNFSAVHFFLPFIKFLVICCMYRKFGTWLEVFFSPVILGIQDPPLLRWSLSESKPQSALTSLSTFQEDKAFIPSPQWLLNNRLPKYLGSIANRLDERAQVETKLLFWLLISNTSEALGTA